MKVENLLISSTASIKDALVQLDENRKKILFVTQDEKLVGSITDGDIRRWILKNGDINNSITEAMNKNPLYLYENHKGNSQKFMKQKDIFALPIITEDRNIVTIEFLSDKFSSSHFEKKPINNKIVIMAGGKGTRLLPYTSVLPKPLIPIGDVSIVERIIKNFTDYGCSDFFMTVNYKKNFIKAYFQDLDTGLNITFVDEDKPLGTAGSLYLLKDVLTETFFVSNCDILINADYNDILDLHKKNNNKITLITSVKYYQIPYGIINISDTGQLKEIVEKPEYNYLVNTGMYIIEPEILSLIPENQFFHITDLINKCLEKNIKIGVYPISTNSWLDMGEFKEMEKMIERLGI